MTIEKLTKDFEQILRDEFRLEFYFYEVEGDIILFELTFLHPLTLNDFLELEAFGFVAIYEQDECVNDNVVLEFKLEKWKEGLKK